MGSFYRNLPTASQRWIVIVALFSVALASAPVTSKGTLLHVVVLVPFVFCVGWSVVRMRSRIDVLSASIVTLYGATIAVEILRGYPKLTHAINDILLVAILTMFGAMLMSSAQSDDERKLRISAIALAPAVYVAVNIVMQIGHIETARLTDSSERALAAGEGASLLKALGVSAQRVQFPLSLSVNAFGAVAAAGFAAATLLAIYSNVFPRRLTIPLAGASLYGTLASDSRTAILIALIVILLTVLAPRLRAAIRSVVLLSLAPILLVDLLGKLGNSGSLSTFTRGKTEELGSLDGRLYIWKGAWEVAGKLNFHTLIGWGANGQVASGASRHYAFIFQGIPHPTQPTSHDILLQTILDGGYLSLAVYFLTILVVVQRFDRLIRLEPRGPLTALRASLLVILFAGVTEALPNYNSDECLAISLVAFGAAIALGVPLRDRALSRLNTSKHSRYRPSYGLRPIPGEQNY